MALTPNDPLFVDSWHLRNVGQDYSESGRDDPGRAGIDLRVLGAWRSVSGDSVRLGILDTGLQLNHPDLRANLDPALGFDFVSGASGPGSAQYRGDNHGTNVAGVAGGVANNGLDGVGVAFGATLVSYRSLFSKPDSGGPAPSDDFDFDKSAAQTFLRQLADDIDVSNNSWGPVSPEPEDAAVVAAIGRLATEGRDGLGAVIVFAGGNERLSTLNANAYGTQSDPHTISVASIDHTGRFSSFSNAGANLLVSAPGEDILTTDRTGRRGENPNGEVAFVDGTSFSAPMVSGVVALMLEANPELGARDVQEILAYSAWRPGASTSWMRDTDSVRAELGQLDEFSRGPLRSLLQNESYLKLLTTPWDWQTNGADNWNGGGLHVSHDYGYGLVDARAAVRLAESWSGRAATFDNWTVRTVDGDERDFTVPSGGRAFTSTTAQVSEAKSLDIEKVEVSLSLGGLPPKLSVQDYYQLLDGIELRLTSPEGTASWLAFGYSFEANRLFAELDPDTLAERTSSKDLKLEYLSNQSWGERSAGRWTLEIFDGSPSGRNITIANWELTFYGDRPTANDCYIYTNEYAKVVAAARERAVLSDSDGGIDVVNFAALTGDLRIFLDHRSGLVDGARWRIADETVIENAVGGDGNDLLSGNDESNMLSGMRGKDILRGGAGNDNLRGGTSDDTLSGGTGEDRIAGDNGNDLLAGGEDADLAFGGFGYDSLTGQDGADRLFGGANNDELRGGAAEDSLNGGTGGDSLFGGDGGDRVQGGNGNDVLGGGNSADLLIGGNGADEVRGQEGTDSAYGQRGIDSLFGGSGDDVCRGGPGSDLLGGGDGADSLFGGDGADTQQGGNDDDTLVGGKGSDSLSGGQGDDVIDGGAGDDQLSGGSGADRFLFRAESDGVDSIADFTVGADGDVLDLRTFAVPLDPATDLQLTEDDGDMLLLVRTDGGSFQALIRLEGLTGLSVGGLLTDGNLLVV